MPKPTYSQSRKNYLVVRRPNIPVLCLALGIRRILKRMFHGRGMGTLTRTLTRFLPFQWVSYTAQIGEDSLFAFEVTDPYWADTILSDTLYEPEVQRLLGALVDIDFAFLDCGANSTGAFWQAARSLAPEKLLP